jgi:hypothetical protein
MSGALQPDYKALSIESNALTQTRKGGNQK